MGRRGYLVELRRRASDLIDAGRKVVDVATWTSPSRPLYTWRRQGRIDRGLEPGTTSLESAALTAANKRIQQLETELPSARRAVELLKEVPDPKGRPRLSK